MRRLALVGVLLSVLLIAAGQPGQAQVSDAWPALRLTPYAAGLVQPIDLVSDGVSPRLYAAEQCGRVMVLDPGGVLRAEPLLDLTSQVTCGGEQGLLSIAVAPTAPGESPDHLYVHYNDLAGDTVVSRFTLLEGGVRADPASEEVLLRVDQPFANHNGGQLAFGPDGYLYIGLGDGGSAFDPLGHAQNPATLLGALLRIDVSTPAPGPLPYAIPPDNPLLGDLTARPEIWALGLRNPWRFSFDPATGDLYIADVGQNAREEVNVQVAASPGGENYGWPCLEGSLPVPNGCAPTPAMTAPVAEYGHDLGCAVTGGNVYRGMAHPALQGIYLYADYCSGRIWGLRRMGAGWESALLLDTALTIATFGRDLAGELYVADRASGSVYSVGVLPTVPTTLYIPLVRGPWRPAPRGLSAAARRARIPPACPRQAAPAPATPGSPP